MSPNDKMKLINQIFNKYYKVLSMIPKGGKIDKKLAKELGISDDIVSILNKAIFYGSTRANSSKQISIKDIERAFKDKEKSLSPSMNFSKEVSVQNFENLIARDKTRMYRVITDQLKREFKVLDTVFKEEQIPRQEMASLLRQVSRDNLQDWDMVVRTELQNKKEESFIEAILNNKSIYSDDKEKTRIYRRPNLDACNHCKRLYTIDGIRPKVFTVEEVVANGSNVGRKTSEWLPTIGVTHPHCQCVWQVMPKGYEFDPGGQLKVIK